MRTRPILIRASWWVGIALPADDLARLFRDDTWNAAIESLRKAEQTRAAERALAGVA